MQSDSITWGETYDISVQAKDGDGVPITLTESYQVACRVTLQIGGNPIVDPLVSIVGGLAKASIDTGDEPWRPGTYYYDLRITDPDGNDFWSEPVMLTLNNRNTPNT